MEYFGFIFDRNREPDCTLDFVFQNVQLGKFFVLFQNLQNEITKQVSYVRANDKKWLGSTILKSSITLLHNLIMKFHSF